MPGGAPQSPPGALHRYYSAANNTHWVTPTPVAGDYAYEQTLGFLHTTPAPGRVAIFGCRSGSVDYFLSAASNCEGTTVLGTYGWMDSARVDALSVAVYRCVRPGIGHFASLDANCEGQTSEGRLGYTRARQPALARYAGGGVHWVTTGRSAPASRSSACSASCSTPRRATGGRSTSAPRARTASSRSTRAARAAPSSASPATCTRRRRRAATSSRSTAA